MKLIIGGACQGKLAYAKRTYRSADGWIDGQVCKLEEIETCCGIDHFHEYVRRLLMEEKGSFWFSLHQNLAGMEEQAEAFAAWLYKKNPEILIVSNELGYGVVPMEKEARLWREACGRMCTALAKHSDEVVRVICGVGQRLAGTERCEETEAGRYIPEEFGRDPRQDMSFQGPYFPVFMDLSQAKILVVGAGGVALRRIRVLLGFTQKIIVVAPESLPLFAQVQTEAASKGTTIIWEKRAFDTADLDGKTMVLAATDHAVLNEEIARGCRERGIPVNVCSDQRLCDFQFPSVVQDGDLVVGVNASGKNHALVKETRQKIEACLQLPESESKY